MSRAASAAAGPPRVTRPGPSDTHSSRAVVTPVTTARVWLMPTGGAPPEPPPRRGRWLPRRSLSPQGIGCGLHTPKSDSSPSVDRPWRRVVCGGARACTWSRTDGHPSPRRRSALRPDARPRPEPQRECSGCRLRAPLTHATVRMFFPSRVAGARSRAACVVCTRGAPSPGSHRDLVAQRRADRLQIGHELAADRHAQDAKRLGYGLDARRGAHGRGRNECRPGTDRRWLGARGRHQCRPGTDRCRLGRLGSGRRRRRSMGAGRGRSRATSSRTCSSVRPAARSRISPRRGSSRTSRSSTSVVKQRRPSPR